MASIRIRVGASADASVANVFRQIVAAAEQATKAVVAERKAGDKASSDSAKQAAKDMARAARDSAKEAISAAKQKLKEEKSSATQSARESTRAARDAAREQERITRDLARSQLSIQREAKRSALAMLRASALEERNVNRQAAEYARTLNRASALAPAAGRLAGRALAGAGRFAARAASGFLRGEGVDMSYASQAQKNVELERVVTRFTNAAYINGAQGQTGVRQDPQKVIAELKDVANATAISYDAAAQGLDKFVAKTGDLETGRQVMMSMAKLSKAYGADLEDVADAAGDVSRALGDVPNKAVMIDTIMRSISAQGQLGSVEIKDLASQMAKVGATASQFSGDRTTSVQRMGALVQMARMRGGAASATQAATSVMSFVNTFSKNARIAGFEKEHVQLRNKSDGLLRNPEDIIIDALRATKGDAKRMGKVFAEAGTRRVTRGFEAVYNEAGGGEAGIEAVRKEFDRLAEAQMSEVDVSQSLAKAMATQEGQAQLVNNQLQNLAGELQSSMLPALTALTPALISMSRAASDFVRKMMGEDVVNAHFGSDLGEMEKARAGVLKSQTAGLSMPDRQAERTPSVAQVLKDNPSLARAVQNAETHGSAAVDAAATAANKKSFFSSNAVSIAATAMDATVAAPITIARHFAGRSGVGREAVEAGRTNDDANARRLDALTHSMDRLNATIHDGSSKSPRLYNSGNSAATTQPDSAPLGH